MGYSWSSPLILGLRWRHTRRWPWQPARLPPIHAQCSSCRPARTLGQAAISCTHALLAAPGGKRLSGMGQPAEACQAQGMALAVVRSALHWQSLQCSASSAACAAGPHVGCKARSASALTLCKADTWSKLFNPECSRTACTLPPPQLDCKICIRYLRPQFPSLPAAGAVLVKLVPETTCPGM